MRLICGRSGSLRLLISGGGTGGHIYPSLVVAQYLAERPSPDAAPQPRVHGARSGAENDILCVIGPRPLDRDIVTAAGIPYERLNVGGIHGMAWRAAPNLARFAWAVPRAAAIIRRFRPDVVLVGGGYVCAPVAVAAWLLRVPVVTLCVDVVPGWAVRLTARLSRAVATAFPESLSLLPRAHVTGYPLRTEFLRAERATARRRFDLPDGESVVLAFGGSLGARAINQAVTGSLAQLLPHAHVIHVTGRNGHYGDEARGTYQAEARDGGGARSAGSHQATETRREDEDGESSANSVTVLCQERYHRFEYLDSAAMADAMAAADLAICRAGAATMAELPIAGTPAILVPGEFSAQAGNARALAEHGAGTVIRDRDLTPERLADEALRLLGDKKRLVAMAAACRSLAHRDAAEQVAAMVREVVGHE